MPSDVVLIKERGHYRIPLFEEMGYRAFVTTRPHDMSFDGNGRGRAYGALGVDPRTLACPHQVHGERIAVVTQRHRGRGALERATAFPATDALVTNRAGVALGVLTADCLPVFLVSKDPRAAGLVHAGWRGVHQGLIAKTVRLMEASFGVHARDLVALLGPAIRPCCYEVGDEFIGRFPGAVEDREGALYFDIAKEAGRQLEKAGVGPGSILDTRMCTCCLEGEFPSYRREGPAAGRSMSFLAISPS